MTSQEAYDAFVQADKEWQLALTLIFGKRAGDVRYTKEGREHPACKSAYERFQKASLQWRTTMTSTGKTI